MEYTIYLDALLVIIAFLMVIHSLILWATGQILKVPVSWKRVAAVSLMGTLCDCLGLYLELAVPTAIARTIEVIIMFTSLGAAVKLCFPKVGRPVLFRALCYVYLFTIVSAGSSMAAYYLTGENAWASRIASVASLLVLIELGWGVIQNKVWPEAFKVGLEVGVGSEKITVSALIDTGNSLKDPIGRTPVVVLEYDAVKELVPEEVRPVFQRTEKDALASITRLVPGCSWAPRLRIIPFQSLGRDDGILVGFRPDYVKINGPEGMRIIKDVVVGVHPRRLSQDGVYQALLNPEIFETGSLQEET